MGENAFDHFFVQPKTESNNVADGELEEIQVRLADYWIMKARGRVYSPIHGFLERDQKNGGKGEKTEETD